VNSNPKLPTSRRSVLLRLAFPVLAFGAATALFASGSGPSPMPSGGSMGSTGPSMTPAQQAAMRYNHGLKQQAKGDDAEKQAAAAPDEKKRTKEMNAAQKAWQNAQEDYETAIRLDSQHYQALGALGYVLRKQGDFNGSLAAYARALQIHPGFTPAIEYRGEAYLGLNKIEEAKADYITLFATDRPNADTLAKAMTKWIDDRKKEPAGVDPAAIEDLSKWLESRQEIATKTSALLPPKDARW
jgi:tetratricopeptide (TPR) repeat protein